MHWFSCWPSAYRCWEWFFRFCKFSSRPCRPSCWCSGNHAHVSWLSDEYYFETIEHGNSVCLFGQLFSGFLNTNQSRLCFCPVYSTFTVLASFYSCFMIICQLDFVTLKKCSNSLFPTSEMFLVKRQTGESVNWRSFVRHSRTRQHYILLTIITDLLCITHLNWFRRTRKTIWRM